MTPLHGRFDALSAVCDAGEYYADMAAHPDMDAHTLGSVLSVLLDLENVLDRGRSVRYPEEPAADLDAINRRMDAIRTCIAMLMKRIGAEKSREILEHRAQGLLAYRVSE
jgi:hypothetical protein